MRALQDIKVLDVTHVLAGPFATYQLGLLGADVLKIEPTDAPDCARGRGPDDGANAKGLGLNYQVQGAEKRALAVDLSNPRGRDILLSLVRNADILVENYATGAMDKLGLGPAALRGVNPGLVYCSLTGYGDTGPDAATGAYDNVIQAASGIIAQSGGHKPGVSFVDYATGYCAAFSIAAALVQRDRTGQGCHISVSMLEVAMQMMAPEAAAALHPMTAARGGEAGIVAYDTAEGQLMPGIFQPHQYRRLAALLDRLGVPVPGLDTIADWPDVWAISDKTRARLAQAFAARTAGEWVALLRTEGLPAERIATLAEAVKNPQLAARDYFRANPGDPMATLPLTAFRMDTGGPDLTRAPPRHGEHTDDVLRGLGMDDEQIATLRAAGVVA